MPSHSQQLDAIINDFDQAIRTLGDVLQHVSSTSFPSKLRVVILNNTIVALSSTIEETLRNLFTEYLKVLELNILDQRKLRAQLQKANLDCAITELKRFKSGSDFCAAAALVSNLERCLNGSPGYCLLKEQITYNQSNFKSAQVSDISKNVGISDIWTLVCDCQEIEDYIGNSLLESRVTMLIAKWNEIFNERDLVVHRISQASGWGKERIEQALQLSKLVITRIGICLNDDLQSLIPILTPGMPTTNSQVS